MAGEYIFTISGLSKAYGQRVVLDNINLCFYHGAKIGIVGENGSGKSTLLKIMAGVETNFNGTAQPLKGIQIGYLPQEPMLDPSKNVRQNIEEAFAPIKTLIAEYEALSEKMGETMADDEMEKAIEKMGRLQDKIEALNGWELDRQVELAMDALMLPPDDMDVTKLSGGERRRVALCHLLLQKPDILLLDEPTNHLDAETVEWLEGALREYPGNVIVVTHDRYFLDNITKWILELDSGKGIPFEGNYSSWLEQKSARMAQSEKQSSSLRKHMVKELEWIRSAPGARRSQNKARVREYEKLAASAQKGVDVNSLDIQIAPGPALGEQVVEFKGVFKAYNGGELIKDLSFIAPRGAIVGIIGPNGVGKTTLFRMIVGQEQPTAGEVAIGQTVALSYVDQHRDDLDGSKTVYEELSGGAEFIEMAGRQINSRAYAARFNFRGPDQQKKVANLSGGERNRLHLAKLLRRGGNTLLLDEPTNDLDVATLRALEDAIMEFNGCVFVISHDRFFLDRICTHLIAFEGDCKARWFEGSFHEYEEARLKELGGRDEKRRSRYKRLPL
ncbi:MAG: energy-dependent translational throttle protein EttA [Nitrospinae bacterium]|nr:energy-dependent translational throttle protein EttA [Nitrospinota bacterium]